MAFRRLVAHAVLERQHLNTLATVAMPIFFAVRITRQAISPRFAIKILLTISISFLVVMPFVLIQTGLCLFKKAFKPFFASDPWRTWAMCCAVLQQQCFS